MRYPVPALMLAFLLASALLVPPASAQDAATETASAAEDDAGQPQTEASEQAPPAQASVTDDAAKSESPANDAADVDADATGHVPAPPAGKGQIVFFREKKFAGSAIIYKVREADAELGQLNSGTWFVHVADPGQHTYSVRSEAEDDLHIEIEPGETYYVIGSVTMGFFAGRPNLSPSDQSIFDGMFAKLKPAKDIRK